jgi:hypothetical protein
MGVASGRLKVALGPKRQYFVCIDLALVTSLLHSPPASVLPAALDKIQHGYNQNWSCPLTPFENRLKVPILAGEKVFAGGHES